MSVGGSSALLTSGPCEGFLCVASVCSSVVLLCLCVVLLCYLPNVPCEVFCMLCPFERFL